MLTIEDELDLENGFYRLNGVKNLLNAWSNENGGYEVSYISQALNDVVKDISEILKINPED